MLGGGWSMKTIVRVIRKGEGGVVFHLAGGDGGGVHHVEEG